MSVLVLICSIFCVTKAALTCNGVEYTISTLTTTTPTDVCYTTQIGINAVSYWYQCVNNEVYVQQYVHPDCLGDAVTFKFTDMYGSTATSFQEACNLGACQYANVRKFSAVWSDCVNAATVPNNLETSVETPFIQNKCYNNMGLNSEIWTCSSNNSQATYSYYSSSANCSGLATQSITINTNEIVCDNTNNGIGGSSGIPIYVTCGSASFAGNDNTLPPVPSATTPPINQCTNTELDCKAVEWSMGGIVTAYPLDVCFSVESTVITTGVSYWYKCQNGVPYIATYQAADCQGDKIDAALLSIYPLSEYVTVCCDLAPCEYVLQKSYVSVDLDCADSDPSPAELEAYTSIPFVSNYCNAVQDLASWKWSCLGNGSEARQEYFMGNGNCTGDATVSWYDIALDVSCDDTNDVTGAAVAIGLQCGTASFNGGSNTVSTSSTTSTSTTPCPSVGCIDQSKANNKYYVFAFFYSQVMMFFFLY